MTEESPISWILSRRSIRKYKKEQIPDATIKAILKAAMYAPSAVNCQPWHFVLTSNPQIFKRITEIHPYAGFVKEASHAILVCGDEKLQHDTGYYLLDCSAATQNILLAAHSLGIGSCWIGIYPREERIKKFKELFALPEHVQPLSLVSLGYPQEMKSQPERYKSERIQYDIWGNSGSL
jgi:nitroreductase